MFKIFLSLNLFTASISIIPTALPKAIVKLKIVGASYTPLKSQYSIMFCDSSILHLVGFHCLHSFFVYLISFFKVYDKKKETLDYFSSTFVSGSILRATATNADQAAPLTCRNSSSHPRRSPEGAGCLGLGSVLDPIVTKSLRIGRGRGGYPRILPLFRALL